MSCSGRAVWCFRLDRRSLPRARYPGLEVDFGDRQRQVHAGDADRGARFEDDDVAADVAAAAVDFNLAFILADSIDVAEHLLPCNLDLQALQLQRLLGFDFLQLPALALRAPVVLDAPRVGVDEGELMQRGDAAVRGEFVTAVVGGGGGGEDFDDESGRPHVLVGAMVGGVAGDQDVGVEVRLVLRRQHLHVGHVGAAGGVVEGVVERAEYVARDRHVPTAGAPMARASPSKYSCLSGWSASQRR